MQPLADMLRPKVLDDFVGQEHLVGRGRPLRRMIERNNVRNMIFYGPPGTGKTTLANIIASMTKKKFFRLNATEIGVKELKEVIESLDTIEGRSGVILYLDEIQSINKKQQEKLLPYIENGDITLITSTADNPYFTIYKAIVSRSTVFQFYPLENSDIVKGLKRAIERCKDIYKGIEITYEEDGLNLMAESSDGDMRRALCILEFLLCSEDANNKTVSITQDKVLNTSLGRILNYDRDGDSKYNILSAFHKSLRGSDVDAALHYLARLIKAEDMNNLTRRLLCVASEDVGMANPQAVSIVKACVDSALQLGFPEAQLPLAQATILLALSPKSNSVAEAIGKAMNDLETKKVGDIPNHIKDAHYSSASKLGHKGYKYPHAYPMNYVEQQYLPDSLTDAVYYVPGNNKIEKSYEDYWNSIKKRF